jgi:hypothetical protein
VFMQEFALCEFNLNRQREVLKLNFDNLFTYVINSDITRIFYTPGLALLETFAGPLNFLGFIIISAIVLLVSTSFLYFSLHDHLVEENDEEGYEIIPDEIIEENGYSPYRAIQLNLVLYAATAAVVIYILARSSLHSVNIDAWGMPTIFTRSQSHPEIFIADAILAIGIVGIVWSWFRFFQTLMISDIYKRFIILITIIPRFSGFLILTFATGLWYFHAEAFPLYWYIFSFGFIYSLIYFFTLRDFRLNTKKLLNEAIEYEQESSRSTVFVITGLLLLLGITFPHYLFNTLHFSSIILLFISFCVISFYMMPGKIFSQINIFAKYTKAGVRLLNFARYTRKYMLICFFILLIFGLIIGSGIFLDPGYGNPYKNVKTCTSNMEIIAKTLEQYMSEYNSALPTALQFGTGDWINKVTMDRQLDSLPECPSGGFYTFNKWLNRHGDPVYEIKCSHNTHIKAGVEGAYPRYERFKGITDHKPTRETP